MTHFKTLCKLCDAVISQCRCPSPDKFVKYDICENCVDEFENAEKAATETIKELEKLG